MQDHQLRTTVLAHRGGQSQRQLGAGTAAYRHQHTSNGCGVGSDQGHIAGRIDQDVLDGVDPQAVRACPLAGAGFQDQQVGVGLQHGFANALRRDVGDSNLATELTRTTLGIASDAGEQCAVGPRHFDALTQRSLRGHLDHAQERAA